MNIHLEEVTNKYLSEFMSDIDWLDIFPADFFPRATDYIPEMILMINKLIKNNMAYIVDPINNTLIDDEKPFTRIANNLGKNKKDVPVRKPGAVPPKTPTIQKFKNG